MIRRLSSGHSLRTGGTLLIRGTKIQKNPLDYSEVLPDLGKEEMSINLLGWMPGNKFDVLAMLHHDAETFKVGIGLN